MYHAVLQCVSTGKKKKRPVYKWTSTVQTRAIQGQLQRRAYDNIRTDDNSSERVIYLCTRKEIFSFTRISKPEACGLKRPIAIPPKLLKETEKNKKV